MVSTCQQNAPQGPRVAPGGALASGLGATSVSSSTATRAGAAVKVTFDRAVTSLAAAWPVRRRRIKHLRGPGEAKGRSREICSVKRNFGGGRRPERSARGGLPPRIPHDDVGDVTRKLSAEVRSAEGIPLGAQLRGKRPASWRGGGLHALLRLGAAAHATPARALARRALGEGGQAEGSRCLQRRAWRRCGGGCFSSGRRTSSHRANRPLAGALRAYGLFPMQPAHSNPVGWGFGRIRPKAPEGTLRSTSELKGAAP